MTECLAFAGCLLASASARQADVRHQLHGDGSRHGRLSRKSAHARPADQSRVAAAAEGEHSEAAEAETCRVSSSLWNTCWKRQLLMFKTTISN